MHSQNIECKSRSRNWSDYDCQYLVFYGSRDSRALVHSHHQVVQNDSNFDNDRQGATVLSTITGNSNKFYSQFGFLVGRQTDNQLTCADNFLIETSNDGTTYTSVFFDDFNRPNGPLGT